MKRLKASVAELSAVVSHKVTFAHVFSLSGKTDATIAILLTKSSVCLKIRAFWLKTSFVLDKNCNTTIRFRRAIHQVCKTLQNQCVKHEGPLNGWNLTVSSRFWILFRARGMPTIHLDSLNINYSSEADKQAGNSKSRNILPQWTDAECVNCVSLFIWSIPRLPSCVSDVYQYLRNTTSRKIY